MQRWYAPNRIIRTPFVKGGFKYRQNDMRVLLIFLTYLALQTCFDAPPRVSNIGNEILLLEHTAVLVIVYQIMVTMLPNKCLINRYYNTFMFGYVLNLLMIGLYWGGDLNSHFTTGWDAFDPIKYYSMAAIALNDNYFVDNFIFFPIAYIYYAIMFVCGVNPLIPMFFNVIIFVYAVILIAKHINKNTPQWMRYYSWLLLIPEAMYFNIMSAKDTLCMLCATIIFVKSSQVLEKFNWKGLTIIAFFFVIMAMARMSLSFASIVSILLLNVNLKQLDFRKFAVILASTALFGFALYFTMEFSSEDKLSYTTERVGDFVSGDVSNAATLAGQANSSFARHLIPHNSVEFIVFGIIRSVCYVVIDPRFFKDPIGLFTFTGDYPLSPLVNFTTLIMFISCFYIWHWWKIYRKKENENVMQTFYITIMYILLVGMFNPMMIHIRYRVVYDILFFAIALRAFLMVKKRYIKPEQTV